MTKSAIRDDELHRLLQMGGDDSARRGFGCLAEDTLAAYADGAQPDAEREAVEEHLEDCSFCRDQVGLLVAAEESAPPEVPADLLARARGRQGAGWIELLGDRRLIAVAAAGMALMVGIQLWQLQTRDQSSITDDGVVESPRQVRDGSAAANGLSIVAPREGEVLRQPDLQIDWQPLPGVAYYDLQVVAADGDVVWQGQADRPPMQLPADSGLAPGRQYYLWVRAHLDSGGTLRSPPVGFETAPR